MPRKPEFAESAPRSDHAAAGVADNSRGMQQVLFGVNPADPLVYIGVAAILLIVAEGASFFPARRATRIDHLIALRAD